MLTHQPYRTSIAAPPHEAAVNSAWWGKVGGGTAKTEDMAAEQAGLESNTLRPADEGAHKEQRGEQ